MLLLLGFGGAAAGALEGAAAAGSDLAGSLPLAAVAEGVDAAAAAGASAGLEAPAAVERRELF